MTERMFAILCVIIMGLTRCYKTIVFLHLAYTNGISIGSAVFAGLTIVTKTDRRRYSVCNNMPHLVLRCGLIKGSADKPVQRAASRETFCKQVQADAQCDKPATELS